MGSKKHKKHHKSDKKEISSNERQEKPLKLVLKVGGSVQSPVHHASNSNSSSSQVQRPPQELKPPIFEETKIVEKSSSEKHSHEKHKKSKKKKKKKSTDKDKERHERKRKHHHHHHHHREHSHDRKEKRRKVEESSRSIIESHDSRDSLSMRSLPEPHPILMEKMLEKPIRDVRTCTLKKKAMKSPLQVLLTYLMKKLQLKDPQEFFAWPVTDVIAPGYSSIIPNPMDFSTISKKIDDREYKTVADFKADVKLMCDNAMIYNRPDTIYYKSAKRLLHVAQKIMNKDQLMFLKRSFPNMLELTVEELGFNINDESEESMQSVEAPPDPALLAQPEAKKSKAPPCWSAAEPEEDDDDEMSPEEILQQAQRAAKAAADRLTLKRPNSKFGFLRQNENGTTTLSIIHPKSGDKEVKVNLEMLASKINQGTGTIPGFKEDAKNFVKPISYTNYGPYCTYAPYFDSTFSNLSKEESDLVLATYGDEMGMQYAESLMSFARESDYITSMADNILDNLTGGEHSKTLKVLEERKALREEEERIRKALKPLNENEMKNSPQPGFGDLESFQTLEDYDLELAQLENSDENKKGESDEKLEKRKEILNHRRNFQIKLDKATQLLHDLKKIQNDRLSANPPPHLALVRQPSTAETDLAEQVTKKLVDVTSQLPPEAIVNIKGLRKAMGITYQPVSTSPNSSKGSRKGSVTPHNMEVDPSGTPIHDIDDNSSDSRQPDLDTEFRDFLSAGSSLRICSSPTD